MVDIKGPLNAGSSSKILVPSLAQPLLSFSWRNELNLERRSRRQGSFPGSLVSGLKVSVKKPLSSHRHNSSFEHFWWSVSESLFVAETRELPHHRLCSSCRSSEKVLQRCLRMKKGGTFQLQATRPLELRCRGNLRSPLEAPVRTRS